MPIRDRVVVYSPSQLGCCCCVAGLGGLPSRQEFRQPKQKRRVFKVLSSSSSQLDPCGRVIRSTLPRFTTEIPLMKLGFICLNVPMPANCRRPSPRPNGPSPAADIIEESLGVTEKASKADWLMCRAAATRPNWSKSASTVKE